MMQEVKFSESVGRTISKVLYHSWRGEVLVTFTDNTFGIITTEIGYDNDIEIYDGKLDMLSFGDAALIAMGVATKEELGDLDKERKGYSDSNSKRLRKVQYDRLKEEFG